MELTRSFISIAQTAAQQQTQKQHNTKSTAEMQQSTESQKSGSAVSMSMFEFSGHRSVS